MPFRSGLQDSSVCRTKLITALEARGVAVNASAAGQLVDKYFSSVELFGSHKQKELSFKDMAGNNVCPCRHQQVQQLPLKHAAYQ